MDFEWILQHVARWLSLLARSAHPVVLFNKIDIYVTLRFVIYCNGAAKLHNIKNN